MKKIIFVLIATCWTSCLFAQGDYQQLINRYVGEHILTLQWLGNETPKGKVVVEQQEGTFNLSIKGEQKKNSNEYVSIDGTLEPVSSMEVKFTGTIVTMVGFINNGEPCVKNGTFTFKKWGNRPFWRLQELKNCEGGRVVDYVDIYF